MSMPLFITVPHAGEWIPPEAKWLEEYDPQFLLTDVDRFVDLLYTPGIQKFGVPHVFAKAHRYAADLNRYPEDIDADSVMGAQNPPGRFVNGFHWVKTTQGQVILKTPITKALHDEIVKKYHDVFHFDVSVVIERLKATHPGQPIFHLDCHSMPSQGSGAHKDSGQKRADAVISDFEGKSSSAAFKDAVISAFEGQGFQVAYNWPYLGGRITQRYGRPAEGHHTIQIELNRSLYMDEKTKEKLPSFGQMQARLQKALTAINAKISADLTHR